jgi:hypothetical protein
MVCTMKPVGNCGSFVADALVWNLLALYHCMECTTYCGYVCCTLSLSMRHDPFVLVQDLMVRAEAV